MATMPTADPALTGAVDWLQGALLGSAALAVAVIAVAVFGLLMMSGRVDWRRGARIILGCFIIFGAPAIASGILSGARFARDDGSAYVSPAAVGPVSDTPPYNAPSTPQTVCWTCRAD